jgi:hypothetical protein
MTTQNDKPWRKNPYYRNSNVYYREDWVTGPDVERHDKYYVWMRARNAARFRGEDWQLTFEEFENFWTSDLWEWRGSRTRNGLMLCRIDHSGPWSTDNCEIMNRSQLMKNVKNR